MPKNPLRWVELDSRPTRQLQVCVDDGVWEPVPIISAEALAKAEAEAKAATEAKAAAEKA